MLIDALDVLGAEIYWYDPLVVSIPEYSKVESLNDKFDVAILAVAHDVIDKESLRSCAPYVFDCTGTMSGVHGL